MSEMVHSHRTPPSAWPASTPTGDERYLEAVLERQANRDLTRQRGTGAAHVAARTIERRHPAVGADAMPVGATEATAEGTRADTAAEIMLAEAAYRAAVQRLLDRTARLGYGDGLDDRNLEALDGLLDAVVRARAQIVSVARSRPERGPDPSRLTRRQLEILRLVADGVSTGQIAGRLYLSRATVRNHVAAALRALGAHSRLEAVAVARRDGLII